MQCTMLKDFLSLRVIAGSCGLFLMGSKRCKDIQRSLLGVQKHARMSPQAFEAMHGTTFDDNPAHRMTSKIGYFGVVFGNFATFGRRIWERFGIILCLSSSYEFWYPICQHSSKDLGVLIK